MAVKYKPTMARVMRESLGSRHDDADYNGQPWRTLAELAAVLRVEHATLRVLLAHHRENAPQLTRIGPRNVYNRGAFRDWWRSLPAEVREKAKKV